MNKSYVFSALLLTGLAQAELVGLDEASLEQVNGQTGIGINMDKIISVGSITYSDDDDDGASGGDLQFQNINIGNPANVTGSTAHSQHLIDVDGTDGLFIDSLFEATRIQVGGISVGSHIGSRSFGQFVYDFEGTNLLQIGGATPSGFLINSTTSLKNVDFVWTTNGASFHLDNLTIDRNLTNAVFEEKETYIGSGQTALVIDIANYSSATTIGGICFSAADCAVGESFGSFSREINLINSQVQMHGGGREGEGITMNMYFEFDESVNDTGDGNFTSYTDDATIKLAKQSGNVTVSGFTFDIGRSEALIGDHVALQFDQVIGSYKIGSLEVAGASMGEFEMIFDFSDATHDTVLYQNKLLLAPGIAFAGEAFDTGNTNFDAFMTNFYSKVTNTSDGISLFNEWNMTADFIYTDDGSNLRVENYLTYGNGYTTLDVRSGDLSIDDSNEDSRSFLAVGVRDYKVNYKIDGLKVGSESSELQNGYEFFGFNPEANFTLNAAIEIRAGGSEGNGITFDGDALLSDANFAVTKTNVGTKDVGVYLDDAEYEFHFRDVTLDVDNQGIKLVLGELWSEFRVGNVRFGDKTSGASMGGQIVKSYQAGSELIVSAGGASSKCMGGIGGEASVCTTNGGYWLDTGAEGITLASKQILLKRNGAKENSATWLTGTVNDNGTTGDKSDDFYEENTAQQLKIDNIYTTDGFDDDTNTYGIQATSSLDVATSPLAVTSLVVSTVTKIKELNAESIQLIHPNALAAPATLIHGFKMQNMNLSATLFVTPIP